MCPRFFCAPYVCGQHTGHLKNLSKIIQLSKYSPA